MRSSLFAVAAVATAFLAVVVKPYLPEDLGAGIGADSVDAILTIIASSMLAVTTFSLGITLSAFSSASNNVTPRAARLLMDDVTTQNALATFLGAFLFSIVGIIALKAEFYGETGRLVLFVVTVAVVIVIFVTFIRWIDILRSFGRVGDTIDRVEKAAEESLSNRLASPYLGAKPLRGAPPEGAIPTMPSVTGYVEHLDVEQLSACAERHQLDLYLTAMPGAFVHGAVPLVWAVGDGKEDLPEDELRSAFTIEDYRTYEQDPRFGILVLAEVASRALSPAVNDPGTAIDILGRGVRLLARWSDRGDAEVCYPRLWIEPIKALDFFEDFFRPIARDGAALVEVQIRLQKALFALAQNGTTALREAAVLLSRESLARAEKALVLESDREILRSLSEEVVVLGSTPPLPGPGI